MRGEYAPVAAPAPPRPARDGRGDRAGSPLATTGGMRFFIAITVAVLFALPAAARPHKKSHAHARARPAPVAKVVPNDRAAQEHARAEAELSDLRAGRVDSTESAEPAPVYAVQENDREVPANLRPNK